MRLREILATHKELASALSELQRKQEDQDVKIAMVFEYLDKLMKPEVPPSRQIGFTAEPPEKK